MRASRLALMETALAIGLWAVSFVFIKVALREVSPVTLIVVRYALGGLVLSAAAALRGDLARLRQPGLRRGDLLRLALLGAVGVALHQLLQVSGQATAQASVAAFLASTAPAFLVALAALFLRERLAPFQVGGILLATLGAALVSVGGYGTSLAGAGWFHSGNILVLLSALVWAIFTILNRVVVNGRPPLLVTAGMMVFGWLMVLPFFLAQQGWRELAGLSGETWGALLYVGLLSTALAYLLYSQALKQAGAAQIAAIQNIEPLVGMLAAFLILGEPLTPSLLGGGTAIIAGVILAERTG